MPNKMNVKPETTIFCKGSNRSLDSIQTAEKLTSSAHSCSTPEKKGIFERFNLIRCVLSRKVVPRDLKDSSREDRLSATSLSKISDASSNQDKITPSNKSDIIDSPGDYGNSTKLSTPSIEFSPVIGASTSVTTPRRLEILLENNKGYYDDLIDNSPLSPNSVTKLFFQSAVECENVKDISPKALLLAAPISYLKNYPSAFWGLLYYSELIIYSKRPEFLKSLKAGTFSEYFNSSTNPNYDSCDTLETESSIIVRIPTRRCLAICYKHLSFEVIFSGGSMSFYLNDNIDVISWVSIINSVSAQANLHLHKGNFIIPSDIKYNNLIRLLTRKLSYLREPLDIDSYRDKCKYNSYRTFSQEGPCQKVPHSGYKNVQNSSKELNGTMNGVQRRPLPNTNRFNSTISIIVENATLLSGKFNVNNTKHRFIKDLIILVLSTPNKNWYELNAILFILYRIIISSIDLMKILNIVFAETASGVNTKLMIIWMIYFWFKGFCKDDFNSAHTRSELLKLLCALKSHCLSFDSSKCVEELSDHNLSPDTPSSQNLELKDLSIPLKLMEIIVNLQGKQLNESEHLVKETVYYPPITNYPRLFDETSDFLTLNTQKLAECITLKDYMLVGSTDPISFLTYACGSNKGSGSQKLSEGSDIWLITESFNNLSYWIATEVCFFADIMIRVQTIEKCIQLAYELFKLRNYNSLMAVVSGLNSFSVRRMRITWSRVRNKFLYKLYRLENFLHPKMNFSQYRSILKQRECSIPAVTYVQDVLKGKATELSHDSLSEDQNIEPTNNKNSRLKPIFCCIPGYRREERLFVHDVEFKGKSFFAKALGGYPIPPSNICRRRAIVPIFFLFIKDLIFAITSSTSMSVENDNTVKYAECTDVVKLLANFSQLPAGIVPKNLVDTYNTIEPYMNLDSQSHSPTDNLRYTTNKTPKPATYHEYTFCKNLFWLKESCLEKISQLHENDDSDSCLHNQPRKVKDL